MLLSTYSYGPLYDPTTPFGPRLAAGQARLRFKHIPPQPRTTSDTGPCTTPPTGVPHWRDRAHSRRGSLGWLKLNLPCKPFTVLLPHGDGSWTHIVFSAPATVRITVAFFSISTLGIVYCATTSLDVTPVVERTCGGGLGFTRTTLPHSFCSTFHPTAGGGEQ